MMFNHLDQTFNLTNMIKPLELCDAHLISVVPSYLEGNHRKVAGQSNNFLAISPFQIAFGATVHK